MEQIFKKYLDKLHTGDFTGAFGLTEPNHGSDPSSMQTKAISDGNYYILDGIKTWITNSPLADIFIVWAKDEDNQISGYILERDMEGQQLQLLKIRCH